MLGAVVPILKELYSDQAEYETTAKKVATICADISLELLNPLFEKYPGLEGQLEKIIKDEFSG